MPHQDFMTDKVKEKRAEALVALEDALDEIDSGEGLSTFVEGHGLQSRRFRFEWREPSLEISFDLPTGRVFSSEDEQASDDAEAGAVIRLALVLLRAVQDGRTELFEDGALSVSCDDSGAGYAVTAPDGSVIDEGDGWSGLVSRLESVLGDSAEQLTIFWP